MMRSVVVCGVVVSLLGWCVSCVENEPPPAAHKPVTILSAPVTAQVPGQAAQQRRTEPRPAPARAERQAESRQLAQTPEGAPVPPRGAQFTIFCGRVQGDAHVERANRVKGELISSTGLRDFYVIHENQQSMLYYGFYRTFNDPKDQRETARAQADLKRIKALESDGNRLFAGAVFVDLEAPDPQAPPEWNLANAPGVWSLQIAAYKDSPMRKEAAVEAVREARAQGIDAYYYHGESISSVCVGAWPEQAVRYVSPTGGQRLQGSVIVGQPVIAAPHEQPQTAVDEIRGAARRANVEAVQGKVEIVDAVLLATMRQYPQHAVNGEVVVRRINGKEVADPSLVIRIPSSEPTAPSQPTGPPAGFDPAAFRGEPLLAQPPTEVQPTESSSPSTGTEPRRPPPPPQPGLGKLKSIDG